MPDPRKRRSPLIVLLLACFLCQGARPAGPEVSQAGALSLVRQGQADLRAGRGSEALKAYLNAVQLPDADYLFLAGVRNLVGEIREGAGEYQDALREYEQAMRILSTGGSRLETDPLSRAIQGLLSREKQYASSGGPVSAELYRGEIPDLEAVLQGPDPQSFLAAVSMLNAGNMYLRQGQDDQAEGLYRQAAEAAGTQHPLLRRQAYANLGWSAIKRRHFDEASDWLEKAMAGVQESQPPKELRRAFLALGVQLREKGKSSEAIPHLQRAVSLYELAGDGKGRCRALAHLGTAYLQAGQPEQARQTYTLALALNAAVKDPETIWQAHGGLAKASRQLGDVQAAFEYYERYLEDLERVGSNFATDQGRVSFFEDHDATLREYVEVAVALSQGSGDFSMAQRATERLRSRALASLQAYRSSREDVQPGTLPCDVVLPHCPRPREGLEPDSSAQLAAGTFSPVMQMAPGVGQPRMDGPAEPFGLPPPGEMRQMAPGVGQPETGPGHRTAVASGRRPVEPPPTTFLEYFVLDDTTVVLVKAADGAVGGAVIPLGEKALQQRVADYRQSLALQEGRGVALALEMLAVTPQQVTEGEEATRSRELYAALIEPVKALLPRDSEEPLVIVPHRALWLLPFAALRDAGGAYLADQHLLSYAASEESWRLAAMRARPEYREARAWVVGNPAIPDQIQACGSTFRLDPLPGAQAEAEAVAALFGGAQTRLFEGRAADRLRLDAWHPGYTVIHLATHGVACAEDPLSSFVVMAGLAQDDVELDAEQGRLELRADPRNPVTLEGLHLEGISASEDLTQGFSYPGLLDARTIINRYALNADLVTLSACQTGLGKVLGQGTVGFARGLVAAGARSLLLSLWRVDDRSTRDLMVAFYREYLVHGNKGLALQRAMQETRRAYPEPRYWAAFTLVGLAE